VRREAKIIVAAEGDVLATVDFDVRTLRALQDSPVANQAFGLERGKLAGEADDLNGRRAPYGAIPAG
jgi:hypothetical protein